MNYDWKRFWSPPNDEIILMDNGFLPNPTDSFGKYVNPNITTITSIDTIKCLILLGEPGIGKSIEIKQLYNSVIKNYGEEKAQWIDLKEFMTPEEFIHELENHKNYQQWVKNGDSFYLFLDSFDEGVFSFNNFARAFARILNQNQDKLKNLFLRISCRTAVWPQYLEESLKNSFEENLGKYALRSLTQEDVVLALTSNSIDSDKFLKEVQDKDIAGLAGNPLTLELIISLYKENGGLPAKKADIYTQGCQLLLQEPEPSKKTGISQPKLSLIEREAIAERIAFATFLSGKSVIMLDHTVNKTAVEVNMTDLQGKEIIDGNSHTIGENQIFEVLNTGLFSSRGDRRMGWAHQTYGEFLAAKYLLRHKLTWQQLRSILFQDPLKIGFFQVTPQLYEIAAWMASLDSNFFDHAVLLDPEFLMLSDTNVISNSQKKLLTEQLLIRLDNGELFDRYETFNYENYKNLKHPNMAAQLKPYIVNKSKSIVVRRSAIEIAMSCSITSLNQTLVNIALDSNENLSIRVRATRAIAEVGTYNNKKKLRQLLINDFKDDPEDELKGVTLKALWPKHISTSELFSQLTPPKKHNFMGAYMGFIRGILDSKFSQRDILCGLEWVKEHAIKTESSEFYIRDLADKIMIEAWENVGKKEILDKFTAIAYTRLKDLHEVIGERHMDEELVGTFQDSINKQPNKRRAVIKKIVSLISQDKSLKHERKAYILLPFRTIQFATNQDLTWIIEWLSKEKDSSIQFLLADIASSLFYPKNVHDTELIYKARKNNSFLQKETAYWFDAIELNSESAQTQRQRWENEQKWTNNEKKDEKEELLKKISVSKIKDLLDKAEAGDTDCWWQLQKFMCIYTHELDDDDIRELPGWKLLDEPTKERILSYSKTFILSQEAKPGQWLGKQITYHPAIAGYRAFKICYERDKDFIEKLDKEIWKKWASIIIGMPLISNDPKNSTLVSIAYKNAPQEIIETLNVLIDEDARKHEGIFLLPLLEGCIDERMGNFLLNKARQDGFNLKAAADIQNFLLKHRVQKAREYVKAKIRIPLPSDLNKREAILKATASWLWHADKDDWQYIWELIKKDTEFGKLVIEKAHEIPSSDTKVLQRLSEEQLAELFIWLMNNFPPEKYSQPSGGGAYTYTPQISIADWRDSVLRVLMNKGTPEASKQVHTIAKTLPQYKWIKEYTLIETRRITLKKSWQLPQIDHLLKLVENHELRIVTSPEELMDIVLDSLQILQNKLQKGEHPQAIYLWNERQISDKKTDTHTLLYSPMKEERLSDSIKTHLQEHLVSKGIIIGREVEVQIGNKTDIHITTSSKDDQGLLKVIIEVKCPWNDKINTAMEKQLVDRYLTADCNHGIYLVGWYLCDKWNDKEDSRKRKCSSMSIEKARTKYNMQAIQLEEEKSVRVKSVVLDIRLN